MIFVDMFFHYFSINIITFNIENILLKIWIKTITK
jgi:hypothetical protein